MGCAASKLEDLPAVALCRDRCMYLEEALSQAQVLADAHVAYLASLRTLGPALHRFFHDIPAGNEPPPPPESDSHLQFPSDSESESKEDHTVKKLGETPTPVSEHDQYFREGEGETYKNSGSRLTSEPRPPPPPPPSSAWDFLNLFDAYEREIYLAPFYSCTNLDLEETAHSPALAADKIKVGNCGGNNDINVKHNTKNIGDDQEEESRSGKSKTTHMATSTATPPSVSVSAPVREETEAMRELNLLFDRASESGNQVLLSLQSHHHTISLDQEYGFDDREGLVMSSQNLSYTLKTLFLWEKKLYHEVKAEERLRITHEKKSRMLKHLEHGKGNTTSAAEAPKLNSLRSAVRDLLTKMKIAIQIVDRISITINKLRDEELWPQIIKFINRLLDMWKAMVECHKSQYRAMVEAKGLDGVAISNAKLSGAHNAETAIRLKLELQNWNVCFSNWIVAQKVYVKALNGWVQRCLLHEPNVADQELTADEDIGAPPIFVICNEWSQAMDRLSDEEVVEAIGGFTSSIHTLLMEGNNNNVEMVQQRMVAENKDVARKVKFLEAEEGKEQNILHKLMRGRGGKKNVASSSLRAGEDESHGERVQQQSRSDRNINLVWDLKQTLMAMEKFTANSLQAYNEIHAHIELQEVSCRQSG
ncbi:protein ALTERED PHOSPHATE STARVATION RESPONSE 1-like [Malus sylvestris]|uniref:protein ALTERED PHOSPHATE STARVATION RESPONSE 1-like n=1 Tax=Malus sylvestris TaxID=3752 RepID=UPI0021ACB9EA|nr:protein ALTERED PHOSPHATE STARVATION RESPONSE 1-like [Malus sylvestris]